MSRPAKKLTLAQQIAHLERSQAKFGDYGEEKAVALKKLRQQLKREGGKQ